MVLDIHYKASDHGLRDLITAYGRVGFELLRKLTDKYTNENVLLSPVSVALLSRCSITVPAEAHAATSRTLSGRGA